MSSCRQRSVPATYAKRSSKVAKVKPKVRRLRYPGELDVKELRGDVVEEVQSGHHLQFYCGSNENRNFEYMRLPCDVNVIVLG